MSPLQTAELVAGALAVIVLVVLGFLLIRRRIISAGRTMMLCALRTEAQPRWRLGLLRCTADSADWFSVAGPSFAPVHTWERPHLDFGAPRPLAENVPGLTNAVAISGVLHDGRPVDLALESRAYTALRAWAESSPPGFNSNVA